MSTSSPWSKRFRAVTENSSENGAPVRVPEGTITEGDILGDELLPQARDRAEQ